MSKSEPDDIVETEGQRLGKPDMDEGSSIASDQHEERDETTGEVTIKEGGSRFDEEYVRFGERLTEVRRWQGSKFKAILGREVSSC